MRPDLYISADVETDGPVPGAFSMLAFGLVIVGSYDGRDFVRNRPSPDATFYRQLKPISDQFEPEALEVNGLDRNALARSGADPSDAMSDAAEWVDRVSQGHRPVLVAYPIAFDWSFLYWYFERFSKTPSPFGHSSCLDIRTLYQAIAGTVFDESSKQRMPEFMQSSQPHTHNALDDAVEQGELFANLFEYSQKRRNTLAHSGPSEDSTPSWIRRHMVPIS